MERILPARARSIAAVLFDLDGTLIDTIALIADSFDYAIRKVLGRTLPRRQLIANIGRPLLEQVRLLSEEKSQELLDAYNEHNLARHDSSIAPYPDIKRLLGALDERGLAIAVVTSKKKALAERGLALSELSRYIDKVVALEDTHGHKPDPEPVQEAIAGLGASHEQVIFVGDSPYDIMSGNSAGVATVAALWGPFEPQSLLAQSPTYAVERPLDILNLPVTWKGSSVD